MRTSRDVYHRLLHDEALGLADVAIIGYTDRFKGPMELPLQNYRTSDIPMHRVIYFRHGASFLWHRETRLDNVFMSSDPARAFTDQAHIQRGKDLQSAANNRRESDQLSQSSRPAFSNLQRVYVHQYCSDSTNWVPSPNCRGISHSAQHKDGVDSKTTSLKIVTLNVLHDIFLQPVIQSLKHFRWDAIIRSILSTNSHFIILTEVTKHFADYLLSDPDINSAYAASDSSASQFSTLPTSDRTTGQLILVRLDISVEGVYSSCTPTSAGKTLVLVSSTLPSGQSVTLCGLHLTSGGPQSTHGEIYAANRSVQLTHAIKTLNSIPARNGTADIRVLAGDFNFKDNNEERLNMDLLQGFVEVDEAATSATYDPRMNGLALLQSPSAPPYRLDRIYVNATSSHSSVSPVSHEVILRAAIPCGTISEDIQELLPNGLHASDHFGIVTTFSILKCAAIPRMMETSSWSRSSSLAIIPDKSVLGYIDERWRVSHDPSYKKWPPHINLLYPFVSESSVPAACTIMRDILNIRRVANTTNYSLRINDVRSFKHKSSSTVYLHPEESSISELQKELSLAVSTMIGYPPEFVDQHARPSRMDYTPHLTIGKFSHSSGEAIQTQFIQDAIRAIPTINNLLKLSEVRSISVLRRIDGRMIAVNEIPLFSDDWNPLKRSLSLVKSLARQIFKSDDGNFVTAVGSSRILQGFEGFDLDVVLELPAQEESVSISGFSKRVADFLPASTSVRCINDAICPIVHINLHQPKMYAPMDVFYGKTVFASQAMEDSHALQNILGKLDQSKSLVCRQVLFQLKKWAKVRKLTGKAFCLFTGISWSVLLLSVAVNGTYEWNDWPSLLSQFFSTYSELNWDELAITVAGPVPRKTVPFLDRRDCSKDACVVVTPKSHESCVSSVTSVVLKTFVADCCRATRILDGVNSKRLWTTCLEGLGTSWDEDFKYFMDLDLRVCNMEDIDEVTGWLKGKFANFCMHDLHSRGLFIRPSDEVAWNIETSNDGEGGHGQLVCGVDEMLTTLPLSSWKNCVLQAEIFLRDKFLRWEDRPAKSSLILRLRDH